MDFESYLTSKRIDSARFQAAEPEVWQSWRVDFGQMHPNSFTVQKLNLINPIRRKYQLAVIDPPKVTTPEVSKGASAPAAKVAAPGPKIAAPGPKIAAPVAKPAAAGGAAVKIPRPGMPKITKPAAAESKSSESKSSESKSSESTSSGVNEPAAKLFSEAAPASTTESVAPDVHSSADPKEAVVPTEPVGPVNIEPKTMTVQTEVTSAADANNDATSKADVSTKKSDAQPTAEKPTPPPAAKPPRPVIPRPVIKPKPKTD